MIIVKLKGGLGNQMFQYATAKSLSLRLDCELYLDISNLNKNEKSITKREFELMNFNVKEKIIVSKKSIKNKIFYFLLIKIFRFKYYIEKDFTYDLNINNVEKKIILDGYWQSYKYFDTYQNYIVLNFNYKYKSTLNSSSILEKIEKQNSVAVHIRRGDYINNPEANKFHGTCDINYYLNSLKYFLDNIKNPVFYFFSDDINWVVSNFKDLDVCKHFITDKNNFNHLDEFFLMSKCKHNIISNSTFSWWAAYLNSNLNKHVIYPRKWFRYDHDNYKTNDLFPISWIKI